MNCNCRFRLFEQLNTSGEGFLIRNMSSWRNISLMPTLRESAGHNGLEDAHKHIRKGAWTLRFIEPNPRNYLHKSTH